MSRVNSRDIYLQLPKPYSFASILGFGSTGFVCSALDADTGQFVAIKVVQQMLSGEDSSLTLIGEKQAGNHLTNIVKVKKVVYDSFGTYLVMNLFPKSLKSHLLTWTSHHLSITQSKQLNQILTDIANALHTLHSSGQFSGTLKPSNVLIDSQYNGYLCDCWGLSQQHGYLLKNEAELETLCYRSPELLWSNESGTAAGDMWAFGMLLLEMMEGGRIIDGENPTEISSAISRFRVSDHVEHLAKSQRTLLSHLLAKDPDRRWSIEDVLNSGKLPNFFDSISLNGGSAASPLVVLNRSVSHKETAIENQYTEISRLEDSINAQEEEMKNLREEWRALRTMKAD
ncbi:putative Protein kinase domain containing protein [Blattamonas nauphoetae]|uniref:Protein kinase domain-containing protein n=1 Tax=Blattamonas nauphoetae TaxID=2049346 RepID=A0ABQ9Y2N0_9EUKA|nr:putative Protein kinase domain containing protein [Blattamonas nauphoetae]